MSGSFPAASITSSRTAFPPDRRWPSARQKQLNRRTLRTMRYAADHAHAILEPVEPWIWTRRGREGSSRIPPDRLDLHGSQVRFFLAQGVDARRHEELRVGEVAGRTRPWEDACVVLFTNGRKAFQVGRNGLLMSMWARQIHSLSGDRTA